LYSSLCLDPPISALICTPLLQIHEEATSLTEEKAATALQPQRAIPLPAPATAIAFAHRDSRFCVAFNNGSLAIYDSAALCSDVAGPVSPLYVHESNNAGPIIDLAPNPEGMSELVAIIRSNMGPSSGFGVELLNLDQNNIVASWECGDTADTTMRSSESTTCGGHT
jgi:nucleoporin NUP159